MNNEELINKTLDLMLESVAPDATDKIVEDILKEIDLDEEVEFSEQHNRRMKEFFKGMRRKELYMQIYSYSKRAAVIFLMTILVMGISVVSVRAWRVRFLNFFIEVTDSYSQIEFKENDGEIYMADDISLEYIPKGFKLEESEINNHIITLVFSEGDYYFGFCRDIIDAKMRIDTEAAQTKKIFINEREAYYSSNDNVNILVWYDNEFTYTLYGNISESELVLIAENIK